MIHSRPSARWWGRVVSRKAIRRWAGPALAVGLLLTATLYVMAGAPVSTTTKEDTQSTDGLIINIPDATHLYINDIRNGTLYHNNGTSVINDGTTITAAQGSAGLKFLPAPNFSGEASFAVQNADDNTTESQITATITVLPVADTPSVTDSYTTEDVQTTHDLVISRNVVDHEELTHFKITGITNGTLYQNDGSTVINNGDFITFPQGNAGLRFTPSADYFGNGTFTIQASVSDTDDGLGGSTVTASIFVSPVPDTPSVTDATTNEDTQTTDGLVITRNPGDGNEISTYQITDITNGTLYKNDGITAINDDDVITIAEGAAGLKFTPNHDSFGEGSFAIEAKLNNDWTSPTNPATKPIAARLTPGPSRITAVTAGATATITINPVADTPSVTDTMTSEDTQSTDGLVISRNAVDGDEVTHFKITAITNGTLYQNDGSTAISDGDFITFDQGNAGLKFSPTPEFFGNGSFTVQASVSDTDAGLGGDTVTATITVGAVADTPSVTDATTFEDVQTTDGLVISRNAADDSEVTYFKITGITNGTLYQNDAISPINDGDFITFDQGNAGLKFSPTPDFFGNGSFMVQASLDGTDGGLGGDTATATITVNAVADTPGVTNATTNEDTQTTDGLVISRNAGDSTEVSHFQITAITNGTLYQHDGTTVINDGDFITFDQGNAGLKFTPTANYFGNGSFTVESSVSDSDAGLGDNTATATITVSAVADTPSVTDATTNEDYQTIDGLVISRNANDGNEVTYFKITDITNGALFQNDGVTAIHNGDFITFGQGNAGLRFMPSADFFGNGSFTVQASISNVDAGLGGDTATATITVNTAADSASVTDATTSEDIQTTDGLVISRNANDGNEVTHFKITDITNGTLFQNDGTTAINNGDFITFDQGNAGLKFTPTLNFFGDGSFTVQASISDSDAGLGGATATATITVSAVADTPGVTNATTNEDTQTTDGLVISRNAADGDEVTYYQITAITNGTLYRNDGTTVISDNDTISAAEGAAGLKFTPSANFFGEGSFSVEAFVDRGSSGSPSTPTTKPVAARTARSSRPALFVGVGQATATITVNPVADTPSVTDATTSEDTQTSDGLVISRNAADSDEVTHFKITDITNGTLYQNDGLTAINNGDFITFGQGSAGLKFTPDLNFIGAGSFKVQASLSDGDAGLGGDTATATITINGAADKPDVTDATTNEDTQTTDGLVISRNAADGIEVTHFKITAITNGTLYQHDGTTAINDGEFITFDQGNAGLKFTPSADFFGDGSFTVQASISDSDAGLGGDTATATITVNPVADTPSITDTSTAEDTRSVGGLVISRNAADSDEVTYFKITDFAAGDVYQNDGTLIYEGQFITAAEAAAGLTFQPAPNFIGSASFKIRASVSASDAGLGGDLVTATITANPVADTPSVTDATTNEDTQTTDGLVISRNGVDGTEVTHFKITSIFNGTLYQNDGTTVISNDQFILADEGIAGLKFTPDLNFVGPGNFTVQASVSDTDAGLGGDTATATITVNPVADTPSVTNATTNEDTQTTDGLVISRNDADGNEVTHFKITSITNGTLYQSDGTTAINDGDFITYDQGNGGLKFTPSSNFFGDGGFTVQASTSDADAGLGGDTATATITVNPVADTPSVSDATTSEDFQTTDGLTILRNANDGIEVTHFKITSITNGTLFQNDGTTAINDGDFITFDQGNAGLRFTPSSNFFGDGSFEVQASVSDSDAGLGGDLVTATITVNPVADTPSVTDATTNEDTQTTDGLVISRNAADGDEVTHYTITSIFNGTLYQNDGTTVLNINDNISVAEGAAGLKFTPSADFFGEASFSVAAAVDRGSHSPAASTTKPVAARSAKPASHPALNAAADGATATITVNPVADTPSVTDATTDEDTQTTDGLVISRNAVDGDEVAYFKITEITNGTLYQNDGTTPIHDGDFITYPDANAGLKFTPGYHFSGDGSFTVQASLSDSDAGLGGDTVTATITVNGVAVETPSLVVDTIDDVVDNRDGLTSLREGIAYAATLSGTPEITFDATAFDSSSMHTITVGSALSIAHDLQITGPGKGVLTLDGTNTYRLFNITAGTVELTGMKLTRGHDNDDGGAIHCTGALTIENCLLHANYAGYHGGAIYAAGSLSLVDTTISNCFSDRWLEGGSIQLEGFTGPATVSLRGCYITSSNGGNGGAINLHLNSANTVDFSAINSTFYGNYAHDGNGGDINLSGDAGTINALLANVTSFANAANGHGNTLALATGGGNIGLTLINNIFDHAGNSPGISNLYSVSGGGSVTVTDLGGNISNEDDSSILSHATDLNSTSAKLRAPLDHGGPTLTCKFDSDSPALHHGNNVVLDSPYSLTTDQRGIGYNRKVGSAVDSGAYEEQNLPDETPSLVVTTAADVSDSKDQLTSLREAIAYAATQGGTPEITFDDRSIGGGTITLGGTELAISHAMSITGPSHGITIDAASLSRVFNITSGTVTLADLTVTGGHATPGAGIANAGTLTLQRCTVVGNTATSDGGGVYSSSSVTATNCTFYNNEANQAGGLGVNAGTALVIACTFSGNTASFAGGGIASQTTASTSLYNTIMAGNTALFGPDYASFTGVTSLGYNLLGVNGGYNNGLTNGTNNDIVGVDWKTVLENNGTRATLADNGGPTKTIALKETGPAFDSGADGVLDTPYSVTTDQRGTGFGRKSGSHVDIGAYELAFEESSSLVVTTSSDVTDNSDGLTSLREAIAYANSGSAGASPEITFDATAFAAGSMHTITLGGTQLSISHNLTITGPGVAVLTVSGNDASRVFDANNVEFSISGMTISHGAAGASTGGGIDGHTCTLTVTNCIFDHNAANDGGSAIYAFGHPLNVAACTFTSNTSTNGHGALWFGDSTGGKITRSLFKANTSAYGGALAFSNSAEAVVTNCTVVNNLATGSGGAIQVETGTTEITNCTFSGNRSNGNCSGVYSTGPNPVVKLRNTLLYDNGGNVEQGGFGTIMSLGHNISDVDTSHLLTAASDLNSTDALLDSSGLADNGGPTHSIALRSGSPARNAGDDAVLSAPYNLTTDQRGAGFARKRGKHVDIGAVEMSNDAPVATGQSLTVYPTVPRTITLAATDAQGDALTFRLASRPMAGVRLYNGSSTASPLIGSGVTLPYKLTGNTITYVSAVGYTGSDSFTFKAEDGELQSAAATVNITVATPVPPTVTIVQPAANAVLNSQALTTVTGTVTDNSPTHDGIDRVVAYLYRQTQSGTGYEYWTGTAWTQFDSAALASAGGAERAVTITGSNWAVDAAALPTGVLPGGTYFVRALAVDKAGSIGSPVYRSFTASSPKPTLTITNPVSQVYKEQAITQVNGTVIDNSPDTVGISKVIVYLYRRDLADSGYEYWNGSTWALFPSSTMAANGGAQRAVTITGTNWAVNAAALPTGSPRTGTYYVSAQAIDNHGMSITIYRTFDMVNGAPTVTIAHPLASQVVVDAALPSIDGTVTDNSPDRAGIASVTVYLYRRNHADTGYEYWNGSAWTLYASSAAAKAGGAARAIQLTGSNWSVNAAAMPTGPQATGTYFVSAQATDGRGVMGSVVYRSFTVRSGPPTMTIEHPTANQALAHDPLETIDGTVTDNSPDHVGIDKVVLSLYRAHTGGGYEYWTGTTWTVFASSAAAEAGGGTVATGLTGGGTGWTTTGALPTLESGLYFLRAYAVNLGGLASPAVYRTFSSGGPSGSPAPPGGLSTAAANAGTDTVALTFSVALDADSAGDALHYVVAVNGQPAALQAVGYNHGTVTLTLDALNAGDQVTVAWSGLQTAGGRALAGQVGPLAAK